MYFSDMKDADDTNRYGCMHAMAFRRLVGCLSISRRAFVKKFMSYQGM